VRGGESKKKFHVQIQLLMGGTGKRSCEFFNKKSRRIPGSNPEERMGSGSGIEGGGRKLKTHSGTGGK